MPEPLFFIHPGSEVNQDDFSGSSIAGQLGSAFPPFAKSAKDGADTAGRTDVSHAVAAWGTRSFVAGQEIRASIIDAVHSDGATQIEIDRRPGPLRMIRLFPQQSVEKWLSRRLLASAVRLDGHKDCIDFSQLPWVVQAKHPPAIGFTIHVQNAEVRRMRFPI
jgi:hypothetical protein